MGKDMVKDEVSTCIIERKMRMRMKEKATGNNRSVVMAMTKKILPHILILTVTIMLIMILIMIIRVIIIIIIIIMIWTIIIIYVTSKLKEVAKMSRKAKKKMKIKGNGISGRVTISVEAGKIKMRMGTVEAFMMLQMGSIWQPLRFLPLLLLLLPPFHFYHLQSTKKVLIMVCNYQSRPYVHSVTYMTTYPMISPHTKMDLTLCFFYSTYLMTLWLSCLPHTF